MKKKWISKLMICFLSLTMLTSVFIYVNTARAEEGSALDSYDMVEGVFAARQDSISTKGEKSIAFKKETTSDANGFGVYTVEFTRVSAVRDMGIIFATDRNNPKDFYLLNLRGGNVVAISYFKNGVKTDNITGQTVESFNDKEKHTCTMIYHPDYSFTVAIDGVKVVFDNVTTGGEKDKETGRYSFIKEHRLVGSTYGIANIEESASNNMLTIYDVTYTPGETPAETLKEGKLEDVREKELKPGQTATLKNGTTLYVDRTAIMFSSEKLYETASGDTYTPWGDSTDRCGGSYPTVLELQHQQGENASKNGVLIAQTGMQVLMGSMENPKNTVATIAMSVDKGDTWSVLSTPSLEDSIYSELNDRPYVGAYGHIYELPAQVGDMPAGTLLFAANVFGKTASGESGCYIIVWRSYDCGLTWEAYSMICDCTGDEKTVWEPHIIYSEEDGYLYCFFANDSDVLCDQTIAVKRSKDGVDWGERKDVVTDFGNFASRPGMPQVTKLGNGKYFLVYEFWGSRATLCYKITDSLWDWNSMELGTSIFRPNGEATNAAPGCVWLPVGGEKGTLIVMSMWGNNEGYMLVSSDYGETWEEIANPICGNTVASGSSNFMGYSPSFAFSSDGKTLYYMNSTNDPAYYKAQTMAFSRLIVDADGVIAADDVSDPPTEPNLKLMLGVALIGVLCIGIAFLLTIKFNVNKKLRLVIVLLSCVLLFGGEAALWFFAREEVPVTAPTAQGETIAQAGEAKEKVIPSADKLLLDDYEVVQGHFISTEYSIRTRNVASIAYKKTLASNADGYGTYRFKFQRTAQGLTHAGIIFAASDKEEKTFFLLDLRGNNVLNLYHYVDGSPRDVVGVELEKDYTDGKTHECAVSYYEDGSLSVTLDGKAVDFSSHREAIPVEGTNRFYFMNLSTKPVGPYYGIANLDMMSTTNQFLTYGVDYEPLKKTTKTNDDYNITTGELVLEKKFVMTKFDKTIAFAKETTSNPNGFGTYTMTFKRYGDSGGDAGLIFAADSESSESFYMLNILRDKQAIRLTYYKKGKPHDVMAATIDEPLNDKAKHTISVTYHADESFSVVLDGKTLDFSTHKNALGIEDTDRVYYKNIQTQLGAYYGIANMDVLLGRNRLQVYSLDYEPLADSELKTMLSEDYTVATGAFKSSDDFILTKNRKSIAYKKTLTSNENGFGSYTIQFKRYGDELLHAGLIFGAESSVSETFYMLNLRGQNEIQIRYYKNGSPSNVMAYKMEDNYNDGKLHTCTVIYHADESFTVTFDGKVLDMGSHKNALGVAGTDRTYFLDVATRQKGQYYGISNMDLMYGQNQLMVYNISYEPLDQSEFDNQLIKDYTVQSGEFLSREDGITTTNKRGIAYKNTPATNEAGYGTYTFKYSRSSQYDSEGTLIQPNVGMIFGAVDQDADDFYMLSIRGGSWIRLAYFKDFNSTEKNYSPYVAGMAIDLSTLEEFSDYDIDGLHECSVTFHINGGFSVMIDGKPVTFKGNGFIYNEASGHYYFNNTSVDQVGRYYGIANYDATWSTSRLDMSDITYTEPDSSEYDTMLGKEYTRVAGRFASTEAYISPLTNGSIAYKKTEASNEKGYGTYTVEYNRTDQKFRTGMVFAASSEQATKGFYVLDIRYNQVGIVYYAQDGNAYSNQYFNVYTEPEFDVTAKHTCVVTYSAGGKFSLTLDGKTLSKGNVSSSDFTCARKSGEAEGGYYGVVNQSTNVDGFDLKIYTLSYEEPVQQPTMLDDYTVVAESFDATSEYISPLNNGSLAYKKTATSNEKGYGTYTVEYNRTDQKFRAGMVFAASSEQATNGFYVLDIRYNQVGIVYYAQDGNAHSNQYFNVYTEPEFDVTAKHTCVVTYSAGGKFSLTLDGKTLTKGNVSSSDFTCARESGDAEGGYYGVVNQSTNVDGFDLKIYKLEYEALMIDEYTQVSGSSFASTSEYISPLTKGSLAYKNTQTSNANGYGTYTVEYNRTDQKFRAGMVFAASSEQATNGFYVLDIRYNQVGIVYYAQDGNAHPNQYFNVYTEPEFDVTAKHICVVTYSAGGKFSLTLDGKTLTKGNVSSSDFTCARKSGEAEGGYYGVVNQSTNVDGFDLKIYSLEYTEPATAVATSLEEPTVLAALWDGLKKSVASLFS